MKNIETKFPKTKLIIRKLLNLSALPRNFKHREIIA